MNNVKRLWILLAVVVLSSFAVLLWFGREIYRKAPPIPDKVVVEGTGEVLFTKSQIKDGQNVWQSTGGQQLGSVWGHGSYVAPDWTADWLHREAVFMLDRWAQAEGADSFEALPSEKQAALKARLVNELRTNHYDPATGTLTVSKARADAIRSNSAVLRQPLWRRSRQGIRKAARGLCDDGPHHQGSGPAQTPECVLLLGHVGLRHQPPRRRHQLHQQLAARGTRQQRAGRQPDAVDRFQRNHAAARHGVARVSLCEEFRGGNARCGISCRKAIRC